MILFSHPTGNANVRNAALGLQRSGLLGEFWTCVCSRNDSRLDRLLPASLSKLWHRRKYPPDLEPLIRTQPSREICRLLSSRAGLSFAVRHETGPFSVDAVYRSLDRRVSRRLRSARFSAVYSYEDGAEFTFREAAQREVRRFYDLPIGYWKAARELLLEEAALEPDWAMTLDGNKDSAAKTARKDAELAMADVILVASSFTKKTLEMAAPFPGKVVVIPYGAPATQKFVKRLPSLGSDPLKVLFVGSLGQRKGLAYLFRAMRELGKSATLTVIGTLPAVACPTLVRALENVRWISTCTHEEVLNEMARHDVFVFPSLFEGFGLVLLEAMAMGLPIIATAHTAAPDIIQDGVEGYIVPIRSSETIAERLLRLHRDRELLGTMSAAAQTRATQFQWDSYQNRLAAAVGCALAA
ncbi:MAG TPA: glycosyltransferase family 4 protein [Chthoniobacterales bacterium]